MGKIQLVREHWNQNYNKVFAAPFQLFLSWVMKETLSSQQLQNLRATSFRVARSLIQFSNSECDLQKFLLLILLLQSECPAVPESFRSQFLLCKLHIGIATKAGDQSRLKKFSEDILLE